MRLVFEIAFKGSSYNGWQRQNNTHNTIQEIIELAFAKIYQDEFGLIACGRTDKGVHAKQFYFHVDLEETEQDKLKYKLNRMLPPDILIKSIHEVNDKFHARFSATSRSYQYYFHFTENPFLSDVSCLLDSEADLDTIKEALELLPLYNDYYAFCKSPDRHPSTLCTIQRSPGLSHLDHGGFMIEITANRFLKSMMRILAYRLIQLGIGAMSMEEFEGYLKNKNSEPNIKAMEPQGLFLAQVIYKR